MLEKEVAALSHFIKPVIGTHYFGELPEGIGFPSVYFPAPELQGGRHSLNTYETTFSLYMQIFHKSTMESFALASEIAGKVQSAKNMVPLYDGDGKLTGRDFPIKGIKVKKIGSGVTQLAVTWDAFGAYCRESATKATEIYYGGLAVSKGRSKAMAKVQSDASVREAVEGAKGEKEKQPEKKFPVGTLRANCVKLFGCTSSTFDGAFFRKDCSVEYTIAEAKSAIEEWLGKGIGK